MPQQQLGFFGQLPGTKGSRRVKAAVVAVATVIGIANGVLVSMALRDRYLFAVDIAMSIAPLTNAALVVASLMAIPVIRRFALGASVTSYLLYIVVAVGLPIAAAVADFVVVLLTAHGGC